MKSTRVRLVAAAATLSLVALQVVGGSASPGGGQLWVTAQDSGRIYVVHGMGGAVDMLELPAPPNASSPSPHFAHLSPSGRYVYVPGLHSGKVYVFRAQDRRLVATIPTPDSTLGNVNSNPAVGPNGLGAHDAKPSPDGSIVLVAHWGTNLLFKIAADERDESWQIAGSASIGARPICAVFRPDGTKAYVGKAPSGVAVVDVATLAVENSFTTVGAWSCSWAQTHDGKTMYLSTNAPAGPDGAGGRVYRLDMTTDTLEPAPVFRTGSPHLHGMGMSEDERTLFLTSRDEDELHIVDIASGAVEELSLDATPGLPDKPDTVAVRGDNVWVTLRASGRLALVKGQQRTVDYLQVDPSLAPCPAAQTLCYAVHSVELGY